MTRIAMVTPSLRGGGLERLVRDLVLTLDRDRYEPAVFCINGLGTYTEEVRGAGVAVTDCMERGFRIRGLPLKLWSALRSFGPDVIHAHSGTWLPSSVSRRLLGRPRLVFTDHGRYPPEPRLRAVIERWCFHQTDRFVAVSSSLAAYVVQYLQMEGPPEVIFNGVDLAVYAAQGHPDRARLRAEWGVKDDEVLAMAVGRLTPVKNHGSLLRALGRVAHEAPGLRLAVVGEGPLDSELRELAESLGLDSRVLFLGFRRDVPACLQAADLFVMPSLTEGMPLSLIEGLASGLPAVATAVWGIPEVLGDPPAGVLVPARDEDALAGSLAALASSPERRTTLGERAAARARDFSIATMTARYEALYDAVTSNR